MLISQGRNEEANAILQKMAKVNGTKISPDVVANLTIKKEKTGSFKDLLKSKTMCLRAVILCFNWMAVCLMYYGVTFNAGNIGDFYLNFFFKEREESIKHDEFCKTARICSTAA